MADEESKKTESPKATDEAKKPEVAADSEQAGDKSEPKKGGKKRGKKRQVVEANLHILASNNNTIATVSETNGNVICWSSAGASGFKGTRKSTPYAASVAVENALNKAKTFGVERVHVSVKGLGNGRDQALRSVSGCGMQIESIREKTAIAHNGCRPKKAPRN